MVEQLVIPYERLVALGLLLERRSVITYFVLRTLYFVSGWYFLAVTVRHARGYVRVSTGRVRSLDLKMARDQPVHPVVAVALLECRGMYVCISRDPN